MNKDAIKRDLDAIKFVMTRTRDQVERQNLAAIGLELNALFLQACGYFTIPSDPPDESRTIVLAFEYPKKVREKSKEKVQRKKKRSIFVKYNGY